ncbi:hypothetical protein [Bradyrhizobium oligotrophicum]|nr:hypothetical protein [Bradyrhizobium oligotrophicum]
MLVFLSVAASGRKAAPDVLMPIFRTDPRNIPLNPHPHSAWNTFPARLA